LVFDKLNSNSVGLVCWAWIRPNPTDFQA